MGGEDHFLHDTLGIVGVLLQVVLQSLSHCGVNHAGYLGVAELGFGLTFELRLSDLHANNCRQAFAEVVRIDGRVAVFVLEFGFLEHLAVLGVLLHHAGERSAETCHVRTALDRIDIIDVRVNVLVEIGVVDHRYLHRCAVLVGIQMDHLADQRCAVVVDVTHELRQTLFRIEFLLLAADLLRAVLVYSLHLHTLILEHDLDASVQVCELTHTVSEYIPLIDGLGKDRVIRPELYKRTGLAQLPVARSLLLGDRVHRSQRLALGVILRVDGALTVNLHVHLRRERVHAAHTYAVQTAGNLVTILVELTAGVEYGHHDLQGTLVLLRVHVNRYTATVILYGNRVILFDMYGYLVAEPCQGLVDRVIYHLIHQVVKTFLRDITDIHCRAFAHRFQSLKHLDT